MMKKALMVVVVCVFGSAAFAGDAVEGLWKTAVDDNGNSGLIEVAPCGDAICGVLVQSFDQDGKPMASDNIGKQIIWDMKAAGDGSYGGGKIWSPDRDKTYAAKMTLQGDKLTVKGCVIGICRDGGTWTRAK
jgi:uncharacterized protein (DUF2147 family)